ncbi:MAG: COG1470 family protein, partial [Candidatus Limnocylindrales bacterium]
EAPLQVDITGSYAMSISTADGRLNATVVGGGSTTLPIVITNDGTAELTDVTLSASPPGEWEVTFEPSTIASVPVADSVTVNATITTAGNAVAGDYQWPIEADAADASDSIEIRTTVETSSIWGFVGLALIAVVIAGLFLVFRRYGRR